MLPGESYFKDLPYFRFKTNVLVFWEINKLFLKECEEGLLFN